MAIISGNPETEQISPPASPQGPRRNLTGRIALALVAVAALAGAVVFAVTRDGSGSKPTAQPPATPAASAPNQTSGSTTTPTSTAAGAVAGDPSTWPAAQAAAPSLAQAINTSDLNLVVRTLFNYKDWLYTHPDPTLVSNYQLQSSADFTGDTKQLQLMVTNHWHSPPKPSQIDYVGVKIAPKLAGHLNGRTIYTGSLATIVVNYNGTSMLDASGHTVITYDNKQVAYSIGLSNALDGQWRISDITQLNPPGGIASVEQP